MRIALIGQAAFGEAVFRALREAGEQVVVVSSVRGPKEKPDPLYTAAKGAGVPVFSTGKLKHLDVLDQYQATQPDVCVMAFVTHILPAPVINSPKHGSIEFHPSLLPRHRGRSAMHWAIRMGDATTGLTVFWVDEGIDTGSILRQKEVEIASDDTVGSLYFDKLYPMGIEALVESVRMVREGTAPATLQDEALATYEHPADDSNSGIEWEAPAPRVYDLVRGSNPQPGAHCTLDGRRVRIFDASFTPVEMYPADRNAPGTVMAVDADGIEIALAGGVLTAKRLSVEDGKKVPAAEFVADAGLKIGGRFANGTSAT
jgi:methionyl-tRNA formyltransferase